MFKNIGQTRSAFTMAEILIAMSIIGVIAALTIPQILGNTSGRSHKIMLQKAYATLSQTLRIAQTKLDYNMSDVDRIINKTGSGAPAAELQLSVENLLTKTMDITKLDKTSHPFAGKLLTISDSDAKLSRASTETATGAAIDASKDYGGAIFETREGVYYIFPDKKKIAEEGCTKESPCLAYIDVNGIEPPNMLITCANDSNTGYWKYWKNSGEDDTKWHDYYNGTTKKGACTIDAMRINDVFPVLIYGATVIPALNAVDAALADHS